MQIHRGGELSLSQIFKGSDYFQASPLRSHPTASGPIIRPRQYLFPNVKGCKVTWGCGLGVRIFRYDFRFLTCSAPPAPPKPQLHPYLNVMCVITPPF